MARITEMTQEQDTGFVPIVSLYENTNPYVPGLAQMMQVDKESLPNFFVLHPMTDQLVKYPEPLEDIKKFSPEMMLTWARAVALSFELEKFAYDIKEAKLREDISDEQKEQVVEILAGYLTDTQKQKAEMKESLNQIKEGLKTENLFADAQEHHVEITRDHMERIVEAHEEL